MLPFHLRNRWFGRGGDSDSTDSGSAAPSSRIPSSDPDDLTYYPSLWDVLKVRYLLQWKASKEGLPTELVDAIIDAAEYWPSTVRHMEGGRRIISTDRDQVLLKTVPLCYDPSSLGKSTPPRPLPHRASHPCRKIVFRLLSHDQGHGQIRENMYESSWTWFDTEVIHGAHEKNMYVDGVEQEILDNERGQEKKHYSPDDNLLLPRDSKLQMNGCHVGDPQDVEIAWHYTDNIPPDSEDASSIEREKGRGRCTLDGRGVRELQIGDSIALWARARFPGWRNHVDRASVRVFWAV